MPAADDEEGRAISWVMCIAHNMTADLQLLKKVRPDLYDHIKKHGMKAAFGVDSTGRVSFRKGVRPLELGAYNSVYDLRPERCRPLLTLRCLTAAMEPPPPRPPHWLLAVCPRRRACPRWPRRHAGGALCGGGGGGGVPGRALALLWAGCCFVGLPRCAASRCAPCACSRAVFAIGMLARVKCVWCMAARKLFADAIGTGLFRSADAVHLAVQSGRGVSARQPERRCCEHRARRGRCATLACMCGVVRATRRACRVCQSSANVRFCGLACVW